MASSARAGVASAHCRVCQAELSECTLQTSSTVSSMLTALSSSQPFAEDKPELWWCAGGSVGAGHWECLLSAPLLMASLHDGLSIAKGHLQPTLPHPPPTPLPPSQQARAVLVLTITSSEMSSTNPRQLSSSLVMHTSMGQT